MKRNNQIVTQSEQEIIRPSRNNNDNNTLLVIPSAAEGSCDIYPLPHQTPRRCSGLQSASHIMDPRIKHEDLSKLRRHSDLIRMPTNSLGFTLVELAIALMVIGLLIGGVLKGQELIENARMTRLIRDFKDYDTATTIFNLTYGGLPGDIQNPENRIPDCVATECSESGDANSVIGPKITGPTTIMAQPTNNLARETRRYWIHLVKSEMVSGIIDPSYTYDDAPYLGGVDFPTTPYGGRVLIVFPERSLPSFPFPEGGHYYIIINDAATSHQFTFNHGRSVQENLVYKIDQKIDDGSPSTGIVRTIETSVCLDSDMNYRTQQNSDYLCTPAFQTSF